VATLPESVEHQARLIADGLRRNRVTTWPGVVDQDVVARVRQLLAGEEADLHYQPDA
jgi:hypothetical protein